jgi:GNAT superfamily N-acetyltransferase
MVEQFPCQRLRPTILPGSYAPTLVPCLRPRQLATDRNWIGKGIGADLVEHALQRCVTAAELIVDCALIGNAVDVEAAAFPSKDDPLMLSRSIAD